MGAGCKAGEVILHICLDHKSDTTVGENNFEPSQPGDRSHKASESRYTFVGQLPVSEKMTVLQLKQLLFDLLTGKQIIASTTPSSDGCGWGNLGVSSLPGSPHHLRLKDFPRGKLSAPLRDDRQLMKCLLVRNLVAVVYAIKAFCSHMAGPLGREENCSPSPSRGRKDRAA